MLFTLLWFLAFFNIEFVCGQRGVSLEEKINTLQEWLYKKPIINMNVDKWKTYVRSAPRNYSMMVMFTALSKNVNCPICKPAYQEFYILANSYRYAHSNRKALYFAVVDYEEAPQIFQLMNLNTAPVLYHFPAKGKKKRADQMDFQRHGFDAESMTRFVFERTEIMIRVLRPPNYTGPALMILFGMLIVGILYMRRDNLEFLFNRTGWAVICLSIVFAFMSGQMWNHIRGPPFIMNNPHTHTTSFIHGSTQYQLIAETYFVAALYAAVTSGFILMSDSADGKGDPHIFTNFSFLILSVFRSKYHGYPYSFLFH
uniref:Magnesium transporter protein 1 n=1 Tax=Syphacia muris TaxID=451379 RepID=A0A0N5AKS6_9BILA